MADLLNPEIELLSQKAEQYRQLLSNIHSEISRVFASQDKIIVKLTLALLSRSRIPKKVYKIKLQKGRYNSLLHFTMRFYASFSGSQTYIYGFE